MQKLPLTLTVITYNEEKNIARCIESVPMASEVIVVDSQSTDKTLEIASALGAKTYLQKWLGFGPQKALAVEKASYDWILSLDADEALSKELQSEIIEKFPDLNPECGYRLPRRSFHLGRWIRYGGWYPDYQKRLFHRKHSFWRPVKIHESIESPKTEKFKNPILHWVFKNKSHQVITNDNYSTLQAMEMHQNGKKFSWLKLLTKPISKFLECYIWKLGILDRSAGFFIAISAAYSVFLKWVKLWELQKMTNTQPQTNSILKCFLITLLILNYSSSGLANQGLFLLNSAWAEAKNKHPQQHQQKKQKPPPPLQRSNFQIQYPLISLVQGKTTIKDTGEKFRPLKRLYTLKDKAFLQTDNKGKIRIELSAKSFLIIEPNTVLEIPFISDNKFSELHLTHGSFRYVCSGENLCAMRIRTDVFDESLGSGDFIIKYDSEIPKMLAYTLKGEMQFRGLEQEKKLILTSGDYGIFIGQKINNQIGFDILLHGQKVAKGQCSDNLKISDTDKKNWSKSKDLIQPPLYPIEEIPHKKPNDICENPYAELNQCAWVCEKLPKGLKKCIVNETTKCVRKRCFADGQWGDEKILLDSQNICTAKPLVRPCDY